MSMSWNDENVARLRELWDQGLPTAQIGKLIGFTKNAVVGKAHRIGLERRPSPIRRTAVKPDRKKARSPVMPKLNFEINFLEASIISLSVINFFFITFSNSLIFGVMIVAPLYFSKSELFGSSITGF